MRMAWLIPCRLPASGNVVHGRKGASGRAGDAAGGDDRTSGAVDRSAKGWQRAWTSLSLMALK